MTLVMILDHVFVSAKLYHGHCHANLGKTLLSSCVCDFCGNKIIASMKNYKIALVAGKDFFLSLLINEMTIKYFLYNIDSITRICIVFFLATSRVTVLHLNLLELLNLLKTTM